MIGVVVPDRLVAEDTVRGDRGFDPPSGPKPTIPEVLPLVQAYCAKPENSMGGSLHIVLADGNIDSSHIVFCREYARERGDVDGVRLANLLLRMSRTQRHKLYCRH